VITSDGMFHLFELPDSSSGTTPLEAFKSLYPPMKLETPVEWVQERKEIVRGLTPYLTLNLPKCNITISNMRKRQLDVVEERVQVQSGGSRLSRLNANAQRQKKCTLRLGSASDAAEWVSQLEKTKNEIRGGTTTAGSRPQSRMANMLKV
jgi:hypothetical protein